MFEIGLVIPEITSTNKQMFLLHNIGIDIDIDIN